MSMLIGEFDKNSREVVKVQLTQYNGLSLLDLRVWANTPSLISVPTKKGLSIQVEQIGELLALVEQAKKMVGQGVGEEESQGGGSEKGESNALS